MLICYLKKFAVYAILIHLYLYSINYYQNGLFTETQGLTPNEPERKGKPPFFQGETLSRTRVGEGNYTKETKLKEERKTCSHEPTM